MSEIHSLLERGVTLYERLIGISRENTTGVIRVGDYEDIQTLKSLDEAIQLDPTGVTSVLLLRFYTEQAVASRSFNWLELLRKPELARELDLPREILAVVESPIISEAECGFRDQLTRALRHYDAVDRQDVQKLLEDGAELAFLRRDALRSIERLRVDQFLDGAGEDKDVRPSYAKFVHQWWNINSLLDNMTRLPSGVSLNLIREPEAINSFFAFSIRDGSRMFVLSDIEPEAHPLQRQMSRRPDRTLERRMARNWFPYDLLNVKFDEEAERTYIDGVSKVRSLAVRQSATIPLQSISEMDPHSLIWTVMMFELILEKFWRQGFKAEALSYTGEMIRHEAALLTAAINAGLPAVIDAPLGLTPLTVATVSDSRNEQITSALGAMPDHPNGWMMERYGQQATEESLNLLGHSTHVALLGPDGALKVSTSKELDAMGYFDKQEFLKKQVQLHQLPTTAFGTKERLDQDRIWLARHNWASQVQIAARKEYRERKDEVLAWYRSRVKENLPRLLAAVGHGMLNRRVDGCNGFGQRFETPHTRVRTVDSKDFDHSAFRADPDGYQLVTVMTTVSKETYKKDYLRHVGSWSRGYSPGGTSSPHHDALCAFTGAKAISHVAAFCPLDAQDIAWLAGCDVSELPDVLQHYTGNLPYTGNSILNRIDPAASRLKNPWLKLELRVRIGMSKRGLEKARLSMTDEVLAHWEKEPVPTL